MSFVKQFIHKKVALAVIVAISGSSIAFAEELDKDSTVEEVEKIVVTARGRTETLQQIPDSVTVFNAEDIKAARITSIKDFSALTPNLNVSTNFRSGLNFDVHFFIFHFSFRFHLVIWYQNCFWLT